MERSREVIYEYLWRKLSPIVKPDALNLTEFAEFDSALWDVAKELSDEKAVASQES